MQLTILQFKLYIKKYNQIQHIGMEEDGGASHTIGNKAGTRQAQTYVEEEALLDALDAVVVSGGRADNGFKSGTFIHLEKVINQKLPNCGLKASPHIDSKIRKWKKQYGLMFDMLNTSGFGWNDVKKCVEVDSDEVWNSYVQVREIFKSFEFIYSHLRVFEFFFLEIDSHLAIVMSKFIKFFTIYYIELYYFFIMYCI